MPFSNDYQLRVISYHQDTRERALARGTYGYFMLAAEVLLASEFPEHSFMKQGSDSWISTDNTITARLVKTTEPLIFVLKVPNYSI